MANVWRTLFGRNVEPTAPVTERLSMDDWARQMMGVMPMGSNTPYEKKERHDGSFDTVVNTVYKKNGIVFACCTARSMVFSEARFQFQGLKNGRPGDLFGNQELEILENPWPNAATGELLTRAIQDVDLTGNFFCVREGKRLRRLRPDWVDIILTAEPALAVKSDIAGYIYKPGGTDDADQWAIYPIDGTNGKVAHWAPTPDPSAQYRGMTWMGTVFQEIEGDQLATEHKNAFYKNSATPNIAVSFKETVTNEQFKEFMKAIDRDHVGTRNAYKTMYLGGGADVVPLTIDFQALDFKKIQGAGETRIAAAARVHPVIVGLAEGMQGSSLNAGNFRSARNAFADGTMRPLWRTFCSAMEAVVKVPASSRLWYDDRDIPYLREDVKDQAEIQAQEATTITKLTQDGFTPESIVVAVQKQDWSLLKHTGLFSVQLQPPMPDGPPVQKVGPDGKPIPQAKTNAGALSKAPNSGPGRPTNAAAGKPAPKTGPAAAGKPAPKTGPAATPKPTPKAAPKPSAPTKK